MLQSAGIIGLCGVCIFYYYIVYMLFIILISQLFDWLSMTYGCTHEYSFNAFVDSNGNFYEEIDWTKVQHILDKDVDRNGQYLYFIQVPNDAIYLKSDIFQKYHSSSSLESIVVDVDVYDKEELMISTFYSKYINYIPIVIDNTSINNSINVSNNDVLNDNVVADDISSVSNNDVLNDNVVADDISSVSDNDVLNDIMTVINNSNYGVYEAEAKKRADFVKGLDLVYCDSEIYKSYYEENYKAYKRYKIAKESAPLIRNGYMTWNDLLFVNEIDVQAKIIEFVERYNKTHTSFEGNFVLELCDYLSSLGFSDSYVQTVVKQFIKDFNDN